MQQRNIEQKYRRAQNVVFSGTIGNYRVPGNSRHVLLGAKYKEINIKNNIKIKNLFVYGEYM